MERSGAVTGGTAFAPVSYDDYRVLWDNWLPEAECTTEARLVAYTLFTDPQLGRVGLTEEQARERDLDVTVAKMPMSHVARALEVDETRGLMKAIIDSETKQLLGAVILGIEGGRGDVDPANGHDGQRSGRSSPIRALYAPHARRVAQQPLCRSRPRPGRRPGESNNQ